MDGFSSLRSFLNEWVVENLLENEEQTTAHPGNNLQSTKLQLYMYCTFVVRMSPYDAQLRNMFAVYPNSAAATTDCRNALHNFKDLRPYMKPYSKWCSLLSFHAGIRPTYPTKTEACFG